MPVFVITKTLNVCGSDSPVTCYAYRYSGTGPNPELEFPWTAAYTRVT